MTIARIAYRELVFGGHLLALGTASIAASVTFILGRTPTWDLLLMAYLFTLGAYSINRASDFEEDRISHPERTAYLGSRRESIPVIAGVSFLVGYSLAISRNLGFFFGLILPLVLALEYSVASKWMKGATGLARLKDGLLVKNLAISFGWALIPVLVGLYYVDLPASILLLCPFIFMRLLVNTIFFDERDMEADSKFGVRTLPSVYGVAWTGRLMDMLDILSAVYLLALVSLEAIPAFAAGLVFLTPYSMIYRFASKRSVKHRDSMRDFAADGEYLLWGVVTYLGHP